MKVNKTLKIERSNRKMSLKQQVVIKLEITTENKLFWQFFEIFLETEENLLPLYKRLMIQRGIDETARADVTRASYGLDDSDAKFLNQVNEKKHMNELKLKQGDDHEIDEFKRKMVELTEENRVRVSFKCSSILFDDIN